MGTFSTGSRGHPGRVEYTSRKRPPNIPEAHSAGGSPRYGCIEVDDAGTYELFAVTVDRTCDRTGPFAHQRYHSLRWRLQDAPGGWDGTDCTR